MIDIGNTKTKYAYFVGDSIKEKGVCRPEDLSKIISDYSEKVKNIMLSSVKPIPDSLFSIQINKKGCKLIVLSSELEMPFKTQYQTPKTLGADRLALVAGAVFVFSNKPVLIIDVGTCITFDFVDSKKKSRRLYFSRPANEAKSFKRPNKRASLS